MCERGRWTCRRRRIPEYHPPASVPRIPFPHVRGTRESSGAPRFLRSRRAPDPPGASVAFPGVPPTWARGGRASGPASVPSTLHDPNISSPLHSFTHPFPHDRLPLLLQSRGHETLPAGPHPVCVQLRPEPESLPAVPQHRHPPAPPARGRQG